MIPEAIVWVAVVVGAFLIAQPAEGEGEGEGEDPCAPVCLDTGRLSFCDTGQPASLDCTALAPGARCGTLSAAWGDDCLLPDGAACDPGYAFGDSRCDDGLACRDGRCIPGDSVDEAPLSPTAGTITADDVDATTSAAGCTSCAGAGLPLAPLGLLFRRRRHRPPPVGGGPSR
jgi:hypothetical protein